MAPKTLTPEQTISQGLLDELAVIAEQNQAGKASSQEDRANKRALNLMADKVTTLSDQLIEMGVSKDTLNGTIDSLTSWAEMILPSIEVTWDRETVEAKVKALQAFHTLGYLTDEQFTQLETIREGLAIRKSGGSGERAERIPQPVIEGRPAKVSITDEAGVTFSTQKGNVSTTVANLKTRVGLYIKQKTGANMPDDVATAILATAKLVVEDGQPSASFGGFTFTALP